MYTFNWFIILVLCTSALTVVVWPGPSEVSNGGPTGFTWVASPTSSSDVVTYNVRILPVAWQPTVVYNCRLVPTLCRAALNYIKGDVGPYIFHSDGTSARAVKRRSYTCPDGKTGWIYRKVNGANKCPMSDQPSTWYSNVNSGGVPTEMWKDANGVVSDQFLGIRVLETDPNTGLSQQVLKQTNIRYSCEEFPAASWVEGGAGASTYCAPMQDAICPAKITGGSTEQNWQSQAFKNLKQWILYTWNNAQMAAEGPENLTITQFYFKMENNAGGDAVYISVNGQKRYCFGPNPTTGAACQTIRANDNLPTRP